MRRFEWRLRSRMVLASTFAAAAVMAAAAQQEGRQGGAPAQGGGGRGNFANHFTGTLAVQQTTGMSSTPAERRGA